MNKHTNSKGVTLAGPAITDKAVDQTTKSEQVTVKAATKGDAKPTRKERRAAASNKQPKVAAPKPEVGATGTVIDPATGEAIVKPVRSIVPMRFKERYSKHGGTCGDDMALELKAATTKLNDDKRETLDVEALWKIAKANEIDVAKYVSLNNGQKRMNVGNKLRGRLAAGKDVVIEARTFKAEDFTPRH